MHAEDKQVDRFCSEGASTSHQCLLGLKQESLI